MSTIKELNSLKAEIKKAIYDQFEPFAKDSNANINSLCFNGFDINLDQYGDCKVEFSVSVQISTPKKK